MNPYTPDFQRRMLRLVRLGSRHLSTTARAYAVQLKMPSLSPTMSEGTIVKWLKVRE
jgi:hypothetical protein